MVLQEKVSTPIDSFFHSTGTIIRDSRVCLKIYYWLCFSLCSDSEKLNVANSAWVFVGGDDDSSSSSSN